MPSPACQVKDGGGAYGPTTNGVDVTPANTVTINLVSSAGVSTWTISCITTDELSDAAAITSALVIDQNTKTATFTAPVSGRAYRFQSIINGGIGPNGTVDASYSTTFSIYTLTAGGKRVHALDETFESHATFGWMADLNDLVRNPSAAFVPSGTGFPHVTSGTYDAAAVAAPTGAVVGTTDTQTLTNKTLTAPAIRDSGLDHSYLVVASNLAANRNITLPLLTGNDTFVFEAHTQTLTNKTLTSPSITSASLVTPSIVDAGSNHSYAFVPSDLAANRNITLPLLTGNDTFVFEAHTQTLTNKTLTTPTISTPKISDSSGGQFYNFAVSDLAADRTVTLPLLTGGDTFVFEAHTQTLTNKTLTSPTIGGSPVISATSIVATGNARARAYSDIANVQTTDATVTSLFTWTILDEAATKVVAEVCGCRSTGAETAAYTRQIRFKRDGGTVTAGTIDSPFTSEETSTWDCTIDNSTSTGRVRITGVAAVTIDWGCVVSRLEVNHA